MHFNLKTVQDLIFVSSCMENNFVRKKENFQKLSKLPLAVATCTESSFFHRMWSSEVDDLLCCYLKFLHLCHLHEDRVLKTAHL